MSIISLIIKREFIAKVRNKSFIVMTFLSPLLFVAIALFVGYLSSMKADTKQIAVHDESGLFVNSFISQNSKTAEYNYVDLSLIDLKFLKDSLTKEKFEGVLFIPKVNDTKTLENKIQYISNDSPSISFIENIQLFWFEKWIFKFCLLLNNLIKFDCLSLFYYCFYSRVH